MKTGTSRWGWSTGVVTKVTQWRSLHAKTRLIGSVCSNCHVLLKEGMQIIIRGQAAGASATSLAPMRAISSLICSTHAPPPPSPVGKPDALFSEMMRSAQRMAS